MSDPIEAAIFEKLAKADPKNVGGKSIEPADVAKELQPEQWQRLRWQCRRGMLELDTLLAPFFDEALACQPARLQQAFVRLLDASDLELFRWLMRGEQPADGELVELIEVIREHRASTYPG